jgi:hypothetical protein
VAGAKKIDEATFRMLWRVAGGASFGNLTDREQKLYARYLWRETWNWSHFISWLRPNPADAFWRRVRRRLLRVAALVANDPHVAVTRIVQIGLRVPEEELSLPGATQAAKELHALHYSVYEHLRASGIVLPELEHRYRDTPPTILPGSPPLEVTYRHIFAGVAVFSKYSPLNFQGFTEAQVLWAAEALATGNIIVPPQEKSVNEARPSARTRTGTRRQPYEREAK